MQTQTGPQTNTHTHKQTHTGLKKTQAFKAGCASLRDWTQVNPSDAGTLLSTVAQINKGNTRTHNMVQCRAYIMYFPLTW